IRPHASVSSSLFTVGTKPPALVLPGIVTRQDAAARANQVNVFGVGTGQSRAWPSFAHWGKLSPDVWLRGEGKLSQWNAGETAFINETLARQLAVREGDQIILRVRKPSALGLDAAISPRNEDTVAVRLKVGAILTPDQLGDFALTAQPSSPPNLFLPLGFLANKLGVPDQAN